MTKSYHDLHADDARRALEAYKADASQDLETNITDLIAAIGHLCMLEQIDFLAVLNGGIRHWAAERVNPAGTPPGPTVEISITVRGLAPQPKPKARDPAKPRKPRNRR